MEGALAVLTRTPNQGAGAEDLVVWWVWRASVAPGEVSLDLPARRVTAHDRERQMSDRPVRLSQPKGAEGHRPLGALQRAHAERDDTGRSCHGEKPRHSREG